MSEQRTEELYELRVTPLPASDDARGGNAAPNGVPDATNPEAKPDSAARREAPGARNDAPSNGAESKRSEAASDRSASDKSAPGKERGAAAKKVSIAKARMRDRLPSLDDDAEVGVQKEHIVTRDGEADLRFTGVLLASAAPSSAPKGHWQEYRVYQTNGGKHVFSKVARNVLEEEEDTHEAQVFDPSPSSVPTQLLRSAREIARSRPLTWMDAATAFFGYDPLAKALYRKLSVKFEETIT
jgi:hypothetical protein